jgi:hypothetical protein
MPIELVATICVAVAVVAYIIGEVRGDAKAKAWYGGDRFREGVTAGKKNEKKLWQKKLVSEGHGTYGIGVDGKITFQLFNLRPTPAVPKPKIADGTQRTD